MSTKPISQVNQFVQLYPYLPALVWCLSLVLFTHIDVSLIYFFVALLLFFGSGLYGFIAFIYGVRKYKQRRFALLIAPFGMFIIVGILGTMSYQNYSYQTSHPYICHPEVIKLKDGTFISPPSC